MRSVRRLTIRLPLFLAVFAGTLVHAQVTCNANIWSQAMIRSEGFTELIGDIVITCTGTLPSSAGPGEAAGQSTGMLPQYQGNLSLFASSEESVGEGRVSELPR